jgi:hypothetical protein
VPVRVPKGYLWVLLCLAVLACSSRPTNPTAEPGPGTAAGGAVYVLRTVAGEALPAPLAHVPGMTLIAVADTIRLDNQGAGQQVVVHRAEGETAPPGSDFYRAEEPFTYELQGSRISISLECNDIIIRSCIAPPHYVGTVTPASLVLESALNYLTPLRYERIRP